MHYIKSFACAVILLPETSCLVHISFSEGYRKAFQNKCWAYSIYCPTMLLYMFSRKELWYRRVGSCLAKFMWRIITLSLSFFPTNIFSHLGTLTSLAFLLLLRKVSGFHTIYLKIGKQTQRELFFSKWLIVAAFKIWSCPQIILIYGPPPWTTKTSKWPRAAVSY